MRKSVEFEKCELQLGLPPAKPREVAPVVKDSGKRVRKSRLVFTFHRPVAGYSRTLEEVWRAVRRFSGPFYISEVRAILPVNPTKENYVGKALAALEKEGAIEATGISRASELGSRKQARETQYECSR